MPFCIPHGMRLPSFLLDSYKHGAGVFGASVKAREPERPADWFWRFKMEGSASDLVKPLRVAFLTKASGFVGIQTASLNR
jgi:hypothetical protein